MKSFYKDLVALLKNQNFVMLFFIFSIMNGTQISLGAIINFLFESFGFSTRQTSIMGAAFVVSGLVSTMIFPMLIQKFHWFKRSLRIVVFGALTAAISTMVILPTQSFGLSIIATALLGTFLIPTLSITYAFATELTFPVSAPLFGCLLQAGCSIFGAVFTYVGPYLINNLGPIYILITYTVCMVICCSLSFFIKEDLRRINAAKNIQAQAQ